MASMHGRINYKNCKFIGSCFNAKAARLRCVGVSKQLGGIQFWMPPSSIVFVIHDEQDAVFAGGVG